MGAELGFDRRQPLWSKTSSFEMSLPRFGAIEKLLKPCQPLVYLRENGSEFDLEPRRKRFDGGLLLILLAFWRHIANLP